MKFGKRYSNITVFMAMVHGIIIGVAAIALVGFILIGTNGKNKIGNGEEEVPTAGPTAVEKEPSDPTSEIEPIKLFAKQHGVFSSSASAATFLASEPSLSTAAIIFADNQYFVWSAVGLSEIEMSSLADEGSFTKPFIANTSACHVVSAQKMRDVLAAQNIAEIQISETDKNDEQALDFNRNITSITAFTKDLQVIRLHLLSHYSYTKDCIKISF